MLPAAARTAGTAPSLPAERGTQIPLRLGTRRCRIDRQDPINPPCRSQIRLYRQVFTDVVCPCRVVPSFYPPAPKPRPCQHRCVCKCCGMWSPYPPITPPHPKARALPALIRLQVLRNVVSLPPYHPPTPKSAGLASTDPSASAAGRGLRTAGVLATWTRSGGSVGPLGMSRGYKGKRCIRRDRDRDCDQLDCEGGGLERQHSAAARVLGQLSAAAAAASDAEGRADLKSVKLGGLLAVRSRSKGASSYTIKVLRCTLVPRERFQIPKTFLF
eukprot:1179200-Prorocentrum_minimum.AAC.2